MLVIAVTTPLWAFKIIQVCSRNIIARLSAFGTQDSATLKERNLLIVETSDGGGGLVKDGIAGYMLIGVFDIHTIHKTFKNLKDHAPCLRSL